MLEKRRVYIRLLQHLSAKDFWNEAIVFVSKDENLNKAHIKYIESRLHEIALAVDRYDLDNENCPTRPKISESDLAEMEEFISNIGLLVNTLGFKIFYELRKSDQTKEEKEKSTFYIEAARGADASGQSTNEGFVVLKGSAIAKSPTNSFPKNWLRLREKLINDNIIIANGDKLIFDKDHLFTSPSAAAAVVMGRSANGLSEWKLKDGRVLKAVEGERG